MNRKNGTRTPFSSQVYEFATPPNQTCAVKVIGPYKRKWNNISRHVSRNRILESFTIASKEKLGWLSFSVCVFFNFICWVFRSVFLLRFYDRSFNFREME